MVTSSMIPPSAAVKLADEEFQDIDSVPQFDNVSLPSITFDKHVESTMQLARQMRQWLKECLGEYSCSTEISI